MSTIKVTNLDAGGTVKISVAPSAIDQAHRDADPAHAASAIEYDGSDVATALAALEIYGTVVDVRRNSAQTIPNATITTIVFNNEAEDPLGYVDLGAQPTRITVPASGAGIRHRFIFAVGMDGNATGRRQLKLLRNGTASLGMTELNPPGTNPWRESIIWEETPAEGDYYELQVYQSSGGDLNTRLSLVGQNPTVFVERLLVVS